MSIGGLTSMPSNTVQLLICQCNDGYPAQAAPPDAAPQIPAELPFEKLSQSTLPKPARAG